MKIVIRSTHLSQGGGANHTIYLAKALSYFGDVYWYENMGEDIESHTGVKNLYPIYDKSFKPDIYIYISHFNDAYPIGKRNFKFCFFPTIANKPFWLWRWKYEYALCNSTFTKIWGLPSVVINPCIELENFHSLPKEKLILNVGNFFHENNGHSKNQHLVVNWFKKWSKQSDYRLILIGHPVNQSYINDIQKSVKNHPNIILLTDISFEKLKDYYARASFLIHALGYERTEPKETEHFGMVALEAMASGCQPIVHHSGGCKDIQGVRTWKSFQDIEELITSTNPEELIQWSKQYDFSIMVDQLKSIL